MCVIANVARLLYQFLIQVCRMIYQSVSKVTFNISTSNANVYQLGEEVTEGSAPTSPPYSFSDHVSVTNTDLYTDYIASTQTSISSICCLICKLASSWAHGSRTDETGQSQRATYGIRVCVQMSAITH